MYAVKEWWFSARRYKGSNNALAPIVRSPSEGEDYVPFPPVGTNCIHLCRRTVFLCDHENFLRISMTLNDGELLLRCLERIASTTFGNIYLHAWQNLFCEHLLHTILP